MVVGNFIKKKCKNVSSFSTSAIKCNYKVLDANLDADSATFHVYMSRLFGNWNWGMHINYNLQSSLIFFLRIRLPTT